MSVNHPQYYNTSKVEAIEVLDSFSFSLGNAIKYLWRMDDKHDNPLEDCNKARWYIFYTLDNRKECYLEYYNPFRYFLFKRRTKKLEEHFKCVEINGTIKDIIRSLNKADYYFKNTIHLEIALMYLESYIESLTTKQIWQN